MKNRIIIILIFIAIFISGTILIFTIPSTVQNTYSLTTQTEDGVTIYFNVFEPRKDLIKQLMGMLRKKQLLLDMGIVQIKKC